MIIKAIPEVVPREAICEGWRKLAEMAMNRLFLAARGLFLMQAYGHCGGSHRGGLVLIDWDRHLSLKSGKYDIQAEFFSNKDALKEVFGKGGWTFERVDFPEGYSLKVELPGRADYLVIELVGSDSKYAVRLVRYSEKNGNTINVFINDEGKEEEINLTLRKFLINSKGEWFTTMMSGEDIVSYGELVLAERLIGEGAEFVEEAKNVLRPE